MPRSLNSVRRIKTQLGTKFDCVAYVVNNDGTPMHLLSLINPVSEEEKPEDPEDPEEPEEEENEGRPNFGDELPYVQKAQLFEEFGAWRSWELPASWGYVHIPKGTTSSSDNRWSSAIDGVKGFNLTYEMDASNLLRSSSGTKEAMQIGWYRLVLTLINGIKQEFSISVRG